jgi:hypothetical protein
MLLYKNTPNVSHLRVFGCLAYVHIPKQNREKLGKHATKSIMIGYSTITKGYHIYLQATKRFTSTSNVTFVEHLSFFNNEQNNDNDQSVDTTEADQPSPNTSEYQTPPTLPTRFYPHHYLQQG